MEELRERLMKQQRALLALDLKVQLHDRLLTTMSLEQEQRCKRLERLCRRTTRLRMQLLHLEEQDEARQTPPTE